MGRKKLRKKFSKLTKRIAALEKHSHRPLDLFGLRDELFEKLKHGSEVHQHWLKDALDAVFSCRDVPPVPVPADA